MFFFDPIDEREPSLYQALSRSSYKRILACGLRIGPIRRRKKIKTVFVQADWSCGLTDLVRSAVFIDSQTKKSVCIFIVGGGKIIFIFFPLLAVHFRAAETRQRAYGNACATLSFGWKSYAVKILLVTACMSCAASAALWTRHFFEGKSQLI